MNEHEYAKCLSRDLDAERAAHAATKADLDAARAALEKAEAEVARQQMLWASIRDARVDAAESALASKDERIAALEDGLGSLLERLTEYGWKLTAIPDASAWRKALLDRARALLDASPAQIDERPPAGVPCLGCGERCATRYARDTEGFGFAMCDECHLEEEAKP